MSQAEGHLWDVCPECRQRRLDAGMALIGALASVGIEHGRTVPEMAADYFADFHERGHE